MTMNFLPFFCVCAMVVLHKRAQASITCEITWKALSNEVGGRSVTANDIVGETANGNSVQVQEGDSMKYPPVGDDISYMIVLKCFDCECVGQDKLECKTICEVDGEWNEWGPWSACSDSENTRSRKRTCIPPVYGGDECDGKDEEEEDCPIPKGIQQQVWNSLGRTDDESNFLPKLLMDVDCSLLLVYLSNYDQTSASLTIGFKLRMTWEDPTLAWDQEKSNVTKIFVPPSKLWIPDIAPESSIENEIDSDAEVSFNGGVLMFRYYSTRITCNRVKTNPEQRQCEVKLRSWAYDKLQLNIHLIEGNSANGNGEHNLNTNGAIFDGLEGSGWTYVQGSVKQESNESPCCGEKPYLQVIISVIIEKSG